MEQDLSDVNNIVINNIVIAAEAWKLSSKETIILLLANQEDGAYAYDMVLAMRAISANTDNISEPEANNVNRLDGSVYRIIKRFVRDKLLAPHTPGQEYLETSGGPERSYYKTTYMGQLLLDCRLDIGRQVEELSAKSAGTLSA